MPIASWRDTIGAIQRRQVYEGQVNAAAQTANPGLAPAVVAHTNSMPWASPQTGYVLAQAGVQPGDPMAQAVATGTVNKKGGGFWGSVGHIVDAGARAALHAAGDVQGAAKVAARGLLTGANAAWEIPTGAWRDIAAKGGDIIGGVTGGAAIGAGVGLAGNIFAPITVPVGAAVGAIGGGIAGAAAQAKGIQIQGGGSMDPLKQSAGGLAIEKIFTGHAGDVDLGTGFLPGGQLTEQATKNAQQAANINGHALTPGRMVAAGVFHPGSTGYNVLSGMGDAIARWNLDPARYVGEEAGAAMREAKVIPGAAQAVGESGAYAEAGPITRLATRAGILDAADPAFNEEVARNFITTDRAARAFVAKAAETDSAYDILKASNGKLPVALANDLAAHTTEQGVTDALLNHIGSQGLREKAAIQSGSSWLASTVSNTRVGARLAPVYDRLTSVMPQHSFSLMDVDKGGAAKLDNAVAQVDNLFTQARIGDDVKAPILNRLMATTTADEAKQVITEAVHGTLRQQLLDGGATEDAIKNVLHTTAGDRDAVLSQARFEVAHNAGQQELMVDGERFPMNKASDVLADDATHVRLPDGRAIRRMTTPSERLRSIYNSKAFLETEHAADFFMGAWKKLNLPRVALMNRMVAMSQAKLAANGLEAPLSDIPTQISILLGRSARPGALEGLVEGTPLSQAEEMMGFSRRLSGHLSADDVTPFQTTLRPGDDGFARSWAARVAEQHADPVARAVAAGGVYGEGTEAVTISRVSNRIEGAPEYMQPGRAATPIQPDLFGERVNVAPQTGRIVESRPGPLMSAEDAFWDGPLKEQRLRLIDEGHPELAGMEGAHAYIGQLRDDLGAITANNPHLMDAVATGKFGGLDVLKAHPGGLVNPDLEAALGRLVDAPDIEVPNVMKAARPHEIDADYGNKVGRMTAGFYSLLGKSMNALVNHPAFNELYWRAIADNASALSEDGQAALRTRLASDSKFVRMPDDVQSSILSTLDRTPAGGAATVADVDKLARAQAVGRLQDMTIDMNKKQGWQDSMRHMMPFAKHWQQETGQWARLLTTHPEAFEKGSMVVQGAEGAGFFHKDAQGRLVFNYPGSGLVSRIVTGTPMPITGKVGGLSTMTTDLFPGFGPGVSILASKVIPNKPEFDAIRDFMAPYGDPTAQGVVASVLPPWAKTLQTALSDPKNDRDAANTTMQVARYLVSTGKYSMDTDDDINRTLEEAGARAKKLLELQALGKWVLPATPTLVAQVEAHGTFGGNDGRTVAAKLLSDDLIQMRKDNYDTSTEKFLDKYGDAALLFLQSATRPLVAGAAATKEQEDWARQNPELVEALPNSYAFFAPQGAQKEDFSTITRQIHMGERQQLTPQQQVRLANDQVGSMIYYQAKAKLGTRISAPQQAWLAQLKQGLTEQYPGFGSPITGIGARVTDTAQGVQNVVLPEMRKALDNPATANSATGQALSQYMELRDGIDKIAQSRGLKAGAFAQAAHAEDLRAVLNKAADLLGQANPGFSMLFDRLLSRELRTDTTPVVTTSA